jgi:tetrapyrrole methylase family protein/MazG family protein
MEKEKKAEESFNELIGIVARLRGEQGCPWDMQQTHISLKPCLLEETYELLEAIDREDPKELEEELGDLLLQVIFHCQIAKEKGASLLKRSCPSLMRSSFAAIPTFSLVKPFLTPGLY